MENDLERRVWDRVTGVSARTEDLRPLMQDAMILGETYRRLAAGATGNRKAMLRTLYRSEQENLARLRGLQRLWHGSRTEGKPLPPESGRNLLEKCWHRTRRAAENYACRMGNPQGGVIFGEMCRREQENLSLLCRLLGT